VKISWQISWRCCVVIFRETFTPSALSVGVIYRESWLWPKLRIFYSFCWVFFSPICWQTCCSLAKRNVSWNLFVRVRDEVQNVFVKSFQWRSGLSALLEISARCRRRTRLNGRLVRNDRRFIRTELQACDRANRQSRMQHRIYQKSKRNDKPDGNRPISQLWCYEKLSWTQTRHR